MRSHRNRTCHTDCRARLAGNSHRNTSPPLKQVKLQVSRYYALASSLAASSLGNNTTICEIGYNAGHSAAVMLTAAPHAQLYVFDIFDHPLHPWAERSMRLMRETVPTRLNFVKGSSSDTLPWALKSASLQVSSRFEIGVNVA
jgi:hypothetical protein